MSDEQPTPQPVLGNDLAFQLASALQAIDDAQKDFAEYKADHKARMETLHKDANRLRYEILTGQKQLPLEPVAEIPLEVHGGEKTYDYQAESGATGEATRVV